MSEFTNAFNYFDNGIAFLRKNHWKNEYKLSLELYNLAAKCALVIKDLESLTVLCSAVSKNARNSEDALDTSYITMSMLAHANAMLSIEHGLSIMSHQLDVHIPKSSSREQTLKHISRTETMLDSVSNEMLLDYHLLTSHKKKMAMKVLAKMCISLSQCKPDLFPLVVITLVRLTIEHGVSPLSGIGFAYYGGMIAELGDLRKGHRFTKLAKALINKNQIN